MAIEDSTTTGSAQAQKGGAEITLEEAAAMMRAGFNLFRQWQLSDQEAKALLGRPADRTFSRWKGGDIAKVSYDTARRLSYLMGIHKALRIIFRDPERGYAWIRKDNEAFGGQSALQRMTAGDVTDLAAVRDYLDAERGGW
ncbi:MAG: DUF2384 domain-containing protein [Rhodospirillales bacterium]|nr:DUF2384 domain-containing protein [Rhodospirillales bacterium]